MGRKQSKTKTITRREFLIKAGIGIAGVFANSCQPRAFPFPTQELISESTLMTESPTPIISDYAKAPSVSPIEVPTPLPTFSPDQLPGLISEREINFLAAHEIREGDTTRPVVMMTYDDNAKYIQVRTILDAFNKYDAKATFFFLGEKIALSAKAVRAVVEEGHLLGCHGWGHDDYLKLSNDEVNKRLELCFNAVNDIVPGYRLRFIRFPYGSGVGSPRLLKIAASWGLQHVYWTMGSGGLDKFTYGNVMRNVLNGAIVLSHMFRRFDIEQAERIIISLLEKGYQLETVETGRKPEDKFI
jgi:peptidoglycan-N-acetylmuramic acid deacetylase